MARSVRLRRLRARGYRTLRDVTVDFPDEGVVFVRSRNVLTNTTSGCGKTALLSAVAYALDYGPPTTSVASWEVGAVEVDLDVEVDGVAATVSRGTDGAVVQVAEEETRRGRHAATWLREVVGPPAMARAASWREQRSGGNFFCLRPAEKARFLATVLGLDPFEREALASQRAADKAATRVEERRRLAEAGTGALLQRQADLAACVPDEGPVLQARLAAGATARDERDVAALLVAARAAVGAATEAHARELADRAEVSGFLRSAHDELRGAERARAEASARVRAQEGPCPTCGSDRRARQDGAVAQLTAASTRLEEARGDLKVLEELLQEAPSPRVITEAQTSLREVETIAEGVRERCRQADRRLSVAVAEHQQQVARRRSLEEEVARLSGTQEQAHRALAEALAEEQQERDFSLLAGRRWQRSVLDEVLAEVTAETNRILARVPNTAECSVTFEAADRGEDRDVVQRLFVQGVERGDDAFSGGQRSSAELAADLAVAVVVQGRGVARLLWMALDEPFDGMGAVDRQAFVELLQERGGLFFVTAHEPEFTEAFRSRGVGIEFDGDSARIVSDAERATPSW